MASETHLAIAVQVESVDAHAAHAIVDAWQLAARLACSVRLMEYTHAREWLISGQDMPLRLLIDDRDLGGCLRCAAIRAAMEAGEYLSSYVARGGAVGEHRW